MDIRDKHLKDLIDSQDCSSSLSGSFVDREWLEHEEIKLPIRLSRSGYSMKDANNRVVFAMHPNYSGLSREQFTKLMVQFIYDVESIVKLVNGE